MALKIRLARGGSKKRPFYSIVVADSRSPRDGRFIAKIGTYNPLLPKDSADRVTLNTEAAKDWMGKGATPTDRVARFLDAEGLVKRQPRNNPNKAKPGKKALERIAEQEQAAQDAAEAEAAAAEAPADEAPAEQAAAEDTAAAEEAPAEETPAEDAPAEEDAKS